MWINTKRARICCVRACGGGICVFVLGKSVHCHQINMSVAFSVFILLGFFFFFFAVIVDDLVCHHRCRHFNGWQTHFLLDYHLRGLLFTDFIIVYVEYENPLISRNGIILLRTSDEYDWLSIIKACLSVGRNLPKGNLTLSMTNDYFQFFFYPIRFFSIRMKCKFIYTYQKKKLDHLTRNRLVLKYHRSWICIWIFMKISRCKWNNEQQ